MIVFKTVYRNAPPVPFQRAEKKGKHHFNPEAYSTYKRGLAMHIRGKYAGLLKMVAAPNTDARKKYLQDHRYGLVANIYMARDKGADDDNFLKAVQDAIQDSGVIGNDTQIDWSFVGKVVDAGDARVELLFVSIPPELRPDFLKAMMCFYERTFESQITLADFMEEYTDE